MSYDSDEEYDIDYEYQRRLEAQIREERRLEEAGLGRYEENHLGRWVFVPITEEMRAAEAAAAEARRAAQRQAVARNQGVALEIHEAFEKMNLNMKKYMEILDRTITNKNLNSYERDFFNYIKKQFDNKIDELDLFEREQKKLDLESILNHLEDSEMLSNLDKIVIGKTVDYVFIQSEQFIELYITTFLEDCAHAYSGENGLSCPKGIRERFLLSLGSTLKIICSSSEEDDGRKRKRSEIETCPPDQKALLNVFGIDINDLLKQWNEDWDQNPSKKKKKGKD